MLSLLKYNPKELEENIQSTWYSSESKIFSWRGDMPRDRNFVIDTPPPTVSGSLHLGHVFSYTQTDIIARFQRMKGMDVFYPIGFDDNGLPSERLVEKENKVRAVDMERSAFQDMCRNTIGKYEKEFEVLFKQCGISFDWNYKYQTISRESIALSQMSFIDLYNKGFILRDKAPTFWDWVDRTAIAQAEIEDKARQGVMNYIYFDIASDSDLDGSGDRMKIEIATTRPELLPACSAVFYHPDDLRYQKLKGKFAKTPIFASIIPILPDEDVDIEKGSGLVMCCTYGDFQDIIWQKNHNLEVHECVGYDGRMKNAGPLDGMKIKAARASIIELLNEGGFLKEKVDITQTVKCAERSGEVLEIIPTDQWYIKLLPHRSELHEQINKCKWYPDFMRKRAEIWNENLNQNWCISRQRYFGVPIPVWYSKREGEEGKILLPDLDRLPVDPMVDLPHGYSRDEVVAEKDVLDTWATSSLTPALACGIINEKYYIENYRVLKGDIKTTEMDVLHRMGQLMPCDLRPQSHEIIRTWAYATIAKSWIHRDDIPWKNLAISGWCLARDNSKMSKSKNNAIDPKKLLNEYGADVVRYWASTSKLGIDIAFSEDTLRVGKKLTRKLWNAAKFVSNQVSACGLNLGGHTEGGHTEILDINKLISDGKVSESFDLWIVSKLSEVVRGATKLLESYDFSAARSCIEDFFWKDFCDNYLEIVKKRSYGNASYSGSGAEGQSEDFSDAAALNNVVTARNSALYTMQYCLNVLLKLFMPYIPHITSELYSLIFDKNAMHEVILWQRDEECYFDEESLNLGDFAVFIVERARARKTELRAAMNAPVSVMRCSFSSDSNLKLSQSIINDLKNVCNADSIKLSSADGIESVGVKIDLKSTESSTANGGDG